MENLAPPLGSVERMSETLTRTEIETVGRGVQGSPWHQVGVDVFDRPAGAPAIGIDELTDRVLERLPFAPRFRRRIRESVTGFDWVDDADFDIDRHITRHSLEAPGTLTQVTDLVARSLSRPFDPSHPQWDLMFVDGLRGGQVAIVTRTHPAYVDGVDHVHLLQELYDDEPIWDAPSPQPWTPAPETSPTDDIVSGVVGGIADPLGAIGRFATRVGRGVEQGLSWVSEQGVPGISRSEPVQPTTRYTGGALVSLAAVNRVRDLAGVTTHDVLLALVTGGLRQWQTQLGAEPRDVVALVPLAVADAPKLRSAVGCQVAPQYIRLPVTTPSPQGRIDQVASLTRSRIDSGHTVGGDRLTRLAGFAPATLHAMAARTVTAGRAHDVFVANVPGPRTLRFFGGWPLHSSYPVMGLADSQDAAVCMTSYNGRIGIGITAAAPVDSFVEGITAELQRLDGGRR